MNTMNNRRTVWVLVPIKVELHDDESGQTHVCMAQSPEFANLRLAAWQYGEYPSAQEAIDALDKTLPE